MNGFLDETGNVVAFARSSDPDTSHDAAQSIAPRIRALQMAVLRFAVGAGRFTDPDMNAFFGVTSSTYRTRRAELVERGMIRDTGERRSLNGESGRRHAVWEATSLALATVASDERRAA